MKKNYYIFSDPHFGHKMLVEEGHRHINFEDEIFEGLKIIKETDIFICLGDVCFKNDFDWNTRFTTEIPAKKKILVLGNHDKKSYFWYIQNGWDFACKLFMLKIFGFDLLFSHKPISVGEDSCFDFNIHGHLHGKTTNRYDEFKYLLTEKHIEITPEVTGYKSVNLQRFLEKRK